MNPGWPGKCMAEVQLKYSDIKPLVCVSFLCQLCHHFFTLLLVKLPHFSFNICSRSSQINGGMWVRRHSFQSDCNLTFQVKMSFLKAGGVSRNSGSAEEEKAACFTSRREMLSGRWLHVMWQSTKETLTLVQAKDVPVLNTH